MITELTHGMILKIVSNFPGAGATSAKKHIADDYPVFTTLSAGDFRRSLVADWVHTKTEWSTFRSLYLSLWAKGGIQSVLDYVADNNRLNQFVRNMDLVAFNKRALEDFSSDSSDWKIWDWMTDAYSLHRMRELLTDGDSVVGEGDLVIAIQDIDQLQDESQKLTDAFPTIELATFSYLLHIDQKTGALRVEAREMDSTKREGKPYQPLPLVNRIAQLQAITTDDYIRYGMLYSIDGQPIDIARYNTTHAKQINAKRGERDVEETITNDVEKRITRLGEDYPGLSAHLMTHLQHI